MTEVQVGENTYQIGRLDARKQFHVARRLAPVLGGLAKAFGSGKVANIDPLAAIEPMGQVIAAMPDTDVDYVLNACLTACSRKTAAGWAPVQAPNGALMYGDLDMGTMLQLVFKVLEANLAGFFSALPSISAAGAAPPP